MKDKQICLREKLDVFKRMHTVNPKARAVAVISVQQAVQLMRLKDDNDNGDETSNKIELDRLHSFWTAEFNYKRPGARCADSKTGFCTITGSNFRQFPHYLSYFVRSLEGFD